MQDIYSLLTVLIPSFTTIISAILQRRRIDNNAAKQAILQNIMEDQFNYEAFKKLPMNYQMIMQDYDVYHNTIKKDGVVTKKVEDYINWYNSLGKRKNHRGRKPAKHN